MSKEVIIDKYWMEFMQFYRDVMQAAKEEEIKIGGEQPSMSDYLEMISDSKKLQKTAIYMEFKTPNEPTFWKWYAINKMNPGTK